MNSYPLTRVGMAWWIRFRVASDGERQIIAGHLSKPEFAALVQLERNLDAWDPDAAFEWPDALKYPRLRDAALSGLIAGLQFEETVVPQLVRYVPLPDGFHAEMLEQALRQRLAPAGATQRRRYRRYATGAAA